MAPGLVNRDDKGRRRVLLALVAGETLTRCALALREEGLEPLAAASVEEALRIAAEGRVDAALIDAALPEPGADHLCRALRSSPDTCHIPLVMLTTRRSSDGAVGPCSDYTDDFLAQPFQLGELRRRMRTAAELGRTLVAVREARNTTLAGLVVGGSEAIAAERAVAYRRRSLVGRTIAGCRLTRRLTRGGRDVYLGEHEVLGVRLCVKLFPVAMSEWAPEQLERFIRGARAAACIDHPNVVPVLNAGREGEFYFAVTRYVRGAALARLLKGGEPIAEAAALRIAQDVAGGLEAAHGLNVIHRDVKPANIIVTPDGRAKLIDFGLAKLVDAADISTTGEIIGTPHYMSPEQCDGDMLDARADIHSLGATMYHMVTGSMLFGARTLIELLRKQIYEQSLPVRNLNPGVSPALARIIERMIAKPKVDRYPSMSAVLDDLSTVVGSS